MKKLIILSVYFGLVVLVSNSYLDAGVNVNINLGSTESANYYRSIARYNNVSDQDVYFVRKKGVPDEELPVIFYLASLAAVPAMSAAVENSRVTKMTFFMVRLPSRLGDRYRPWTGAAPVA